MIRGTGHHHSPDFLPARVPTRLGGPLLPMRFTATTCRYLDPDDGADHPEAAFIDGDAAVVPLRTRRPRPNYPLRHQASEVKSP